jgi:hypothetical protein
VKEASIISFSVAEVCVSERGEGRGRYSQGESFLERRGERWGSEQGDEMPGPC